MQNEPKTAELDPSGLFKIALDREETNIVVLHYEAAMDSPCKIIKGKTAESVYVKIFELGLVSRLDHAAYLGRELAKAEICLKTGKDYIQDSHLFKE